MFGGISCKDKKHEHLEIYENIKLRVINLNKRVKLKFLRRKKAKK